MDIALQDLETTEHHHSRWWIILCLFLPDLARTTIVSLPIEIESLLIVAIECSIPDIIDITDQFIDPYSFSFSLDCYGIEFTGKIG
jgi:hypothetical protein